jgi:hypothetical protein
MYENSMQLEALITHYKASGYKITDFSKDGLRLRITWDK